MEQSFSRLAVWASKQCGKSVSFVIAWVFIILWLCTGPYFDFVDAWQITGNSIISVLTFLMIFLLQNTQNRESAAIQVKLDELIRVTKSARNSLIDLENQSDSEIQSVKQTLSNLKDNVCK